MGRPRALALCSLLVWPFAMLPLAAPRALAAPSPDAGEPTAPPAKLPIIGRSKSQHYCALETERTNGAITVALTNDKVISIGIARLRAADLDRDNLTVIDREKTMRDLRAVSIALNHNLHAGAAELADLRELSVKEPDAKRSPELKALADDLDDAMTRQKSVGDDLAKMLTIVEGRYARAQGEHEAAGVVPETQDEHVRNGIESIDQRAAHEPLNALFTDVADDFSGRAVEIGKSEDAAAVHAPKAVAGC